MAARACFIKINLAEALRPADWNCFVRGLGGFPASHPLNIGMMGMHGEAWVNHAIQEADLLLVDVMVDIPALIESLSSTMTLRPGAVILTGTPQGVGFPLWVVYAVWIAGTILLVTGAALNYRFLRELLVYRGPALVHECAAAIRRRKEAPSIGNLPPA